MDIVTFVEKLKYMEQLFIFKREQPIPSLGTDPDVTGIVVLEFGIKMHFIFKETIQCKLYFSIFSTHPSCDFDFRLKINRNSLGYRELREPIRARENKYCSFFGKY